MAQPGDDDFFEDEFDREDTVEVEDTFADSFEDAQASVTGKGAAAFQDVKALATGKGAAALKDAKTFATGQSAAVKEALIKQKEATAKALQAEKDALFSDDEDDEEEEEDEEAPETKVSELHKKFPHTDLHKAEAKMVKAVAAAKALKKEAEKKAAAKKKEDAEKAAVAAAKKKEDEEKAAIVAAALKAKKEAEAKAAAAAKIKADAAIAKANQERKEWLDKAAKDLLDNQETFDNKRCNRIRTLKKRSNSKVTAMANLISDQYNLMEKDFAISYEHLDDITYEATLEFCAEGAALDQECFKLGTDGTDRRYDSLWLAWDTTPDGQVSTEEFEAAWNSMNLDNNPQVSSLEVAAYFTRNQYIVCRPLREKVLRALKQQERDMFKSLFYFLDADSNRKINTADVDVALRMWDKTVRAEGEEPSVDAEEWKDAIGQVFSDLCAETMTTDRRGWLRRTRRQTQSKMDLFQLLDENNDGQLVREEYKHVYALMDTDKNIRLSPREVKRWVDAHLSSICAEHRPAMLKARKEADAAAALDSYAINEAYFLLDADGESEHATEEDAKDLLNYVDTNQDGVVTRQELVDQFYQVFSDLAFEDALGYSNPRQWLADISEIDATVDQNELEKLFPTEGSTIGEEELRKIYRQLDLNNDGVVSREEIAALFQKNKARASAPFLKEIITGLQKLNEQTLQPIQFMSGPYEYYYSSQDHVLPYYKSDEFCQSWGGQLLVLSSAEEAKALLEIQGKKTEHIQWYGSYENKDLFGYKLPTPNQADDESDCIEHLPGSSTLRWATTCENENEFICRKMKPLPTADQAVKLDEDEVTAEVQLLEGSMRQVSSNLLMIIIIVVVVVILLIVIIAAICCKKKASPVTTQKVPTATPMGSPRGRDVPSATVPDKEAENPGFGNDTPNGQMTGLIPDIQKSNDIVVNTNPVDRTQAE